MPRLKTTKTDADVGDLLLDLENPRTGAVVGQAEALEAIIRLNSQHFRNMMGSIKENDLDPGDSFYVIPDEDEGSFIVVDGNRRLAALKVLNNPDLLDGTKLSDNTKKRLREAARDFVPVEAISCVVFESREDANDWIERRHGKGLEGEGRTRSLTNVNWIVSYDDVEPIHALYHDVSCLRYTIGYSARERSRGAEAMFFSPGLTIPLVRGSMVELDRHPQAAA